jgi:5-methylcytosine-specific restriction endonuclease McrA
VRAFFIVRKEAAGVKAWAEQFYNSDAWRACREGFLQSKGYLCERCSTPDNPVVAKIAHHKIYLTKENINNPYITLSWDNLEALCQDCHNKEHHRSERKKRYSFDANGNLVYPPPFAAELGRAKHRGREVKKTPQARA